LKEDPTVDKEEQPGFLWTRALNPTSRWGVSIRVGRSGGLLAGTVKDALYCSAFQGKKRSEVEIEKKEKG
jgi:hypothetical protein